MGLVTDTGRFQQENANPESHRVAAALHEAGIDVADLCRKLFATRSQAALKILGRGLGSLRLEADGHLRTCLSRDDTPSLRDMVRQGADDEAIARAIRQMVWGKVAGHEAHLGTAFEGVMTRIGG